MSDPPRLRELADGSSFARDLLRHAEPTRALTPGDALRLNATVAKAGSVAASSSSWAAALTAPKVLAVVTALALGGAAVKTVTHRSPTRVTAAHVAAPRGVRAHAVAPSPAAETPVEAPRVEAPVTAPAAVVDAPVARVAHRRVAVVAPPAPTPVVEAPAPTLSDELGVIDEARRSLAHDPARAAEALASAARRMPAGQLRDERDALLVEALARCNRWDEARAAADALARRDPQSPQSARVRALLRDAP